MGEEKAKIPLFPILQSDEPALSGIARIAACGHEVDHGHLVEFLSLDAKSILNRSVSKRMHYFRWSINPYRGCEFGCRYCYARYTHEFMELRDPELFERQIYIKQNAAWLFRQELRKIKRGEYLALGTATDPYQPIERRARVTRSLLEVFAEQAGLQLGIVTKSTLIERDIDLLQRIAARNRLVVHITITTPDAGLARILEPRAPRPDLRFRTVAALRRAGLETGILCCPVMPGITDTAPALESVARRAQRAGASFMAANPLFLKPCSRPTFLAFIHDHFPQLEDHYAKRYGNADFVSEAYRKRVADIVAAVLRKYELDRRPTDRLLLQKLASFPDLPADSAGSPGPALPVQQELWPSAKPSGALYGRRRETRSA
ncbi:radical SAM protein [Acidipila sp. 4G-K13]|uniref:Radical SAM protein n=2 Tax=Paracidobacterium acidisoli TaxID=2303751 RepID=A0A372IUU0_9BACT|nr:radical SAM protein [Paracidobacterium acidisoli]MBT9329765.1 radical SAM protein [Paracidobacterium acidisoli]